MNPLRAMAIQSARTPVLGHIPGGLPPEIDPPTAAAMCAGMEEFTYRLALLAWGGQIEQYEWLRIELWRKAMELSQANSWKTKRYNTKERPLTLAMAELALMEAVNPPLNMLEEKEGWEKRARFLFPDGLSKSAWYQNWGKKYAVVAGVLDAALGDAYRHISRAQWDWGDESKGRAQGG